MEVRMAEIVFWLALAAVVFAYAGYSVVVFLLSRVLRRPVTRQDIEPTVTFLITAYNEERNIAAKIEQTLSLDYPTDKLELIVASDGSTDRTDEIVRSFAGRGVRLIRVEGRVGKTETQNRAVRQATGDIIVFSDATTRYEQSALRKIVRNYADPTVGAVSGRYEYFNPTGAPIGLGSILFWRYENAIKSMQTQVRTITGCCGCIYSVRRALYTPLPPDIISDLCEPLKVLEKGYRIVFEPEAIAFEETTEKTREEFNMRVRVVTRGMRGLMYMRALLNPLRHGFVAFQLLSHKVMRWLVPLFLGVALLANVALLGRPLYDVLFVLQLSFYVIAAIGYLAERRSIRVGPFAIPLYFCTVNAAAVVAMYRIWKGHKAVTWETVRR
jgi:cellulose synthase/poly-beta-1,6-N-acetylglucosamine synthase-like glycosyltransferase